MIGHIDAEWEDLRRRAAEEHDLTTLATVLCDIAAAAQQEDDLRRLRQMLTELAAAAKRKEQEAGNRDQELSTGVYGKSDPNDLLDRLLLLDRRVMEASMRVYNIPEQGRVAMQGESRRLHDAIRNQWLHPKKFPVQASSFEQAKADMDQSFDCPAACALSAREICGAILHEKPAAPSKLSRSHLIKHRPE